MLICGINSSHTASAALFRDGHLVSALQEERPTRRKNQSGFPESALKLLLKEAGLAWGDVDAYVFGGVETYREIGLKEGDRSARIRSYKELSGPLNRIRRVLRRTGVRAWVHRRRRAADQEILFRHGVPRDRVFVVDHHTCHAATAYYGGGADPDAIVLTADGAGDGLCATVSVPGPDGTLQRIAEVPEAESIGNLWAVITSLLAMVPMEHEYKLMGLAPYAQGERVDEVERLFSAAFVQDEGTWRRAPGVPDLLYSYEYWRERLEFVRFDHVCAGLQNFTERFLASWVQYWLRRTGRSKVRLSGGVFMNVKVNKVIGELPECRELFVFPSCGDETNCMGAAWAFLARRGMAASIEPLESLYLGPEPAREDLLQAAQAAEEYGWHVQAPEDMAAAIAELLARGEVVARIAGREEFGARALGNRSILADPTQAGIVQVVNRAIKCRDFWMPFAPVMLEEAAKRYLVNPKELKAPYMILAFDARHVEEVKAASHPEDGTVRPQVIYRAWNPDYHRILERFQERTGRGALLNTSFNLHGEPIVSTPADAVEVMRRSGLLHLALGPYLISKPGTPRLESAGAGAASASIIFTVRGT